MTKITIFRAVRIKQGKKTFKKQLPPRLPPVKEEPAEEEEDPGDEERQEPEKQKTKKQKTWTARDKKVELGTVFDRSWPAVRHAGQMLGRACCALFAKIQCNLLS